MPRTDSSERALPDPRVVPMLRVEEAGRILDLSRRAVYELVARGELESVRFGERRIRVPTIAVWKLCKLTPPGEAA